MRLEVCRSANSKPWFNTFGIIAHYKKRFQKANITPAQIRTLDYIKKLPFLTKEDLRKDQETHPPWGSMLAVPMKETQRVHMTSGTTGTPIKILDTPEDWSQ